MSTGTILDKIIARKQEEIAAGKNNYTLGELEAMAEKMAAETDAEAEARPTYTQVSRCVPAACMPLVREQEFMNMNS